MEKIICLCYTVFKHIFDGMVHKMKLVKEKTWKVTKQLWFLPLYFIYRLILQFFQPLFNEAVVTSVGHERISRFLDGRIHISFSVGELFLVVLPTAAVAVALVVFLYRLIREKKRISSQRVPDQEFMNKLRSIIEDYDYVESIQIYQYKNKQEKDFKIKLNFLSGLADEDIEINSVMQAYFKIPFKIYKTLKSFCNLYDNYTAETSEEARTALEVRFKDIGYRLVQTFLTRLNSIQKISEITEYDFVYYRLLRIVFQIINGNGLARYIVDQDIENYLLRGKKTGLIGSVILNSPQAFKNETSYNKKNRIYFTYKVKNYKQMKRLIVLISVREGQLDKSNKIDKYGEEIFNRLNQELFQNLNTQSE